MRTGENRTINGSDYVCTMDSRRAKLVGLRLYLTTTTNQVVYDRVLALHVLPQQVELTALLENVTNRVVLGDIAYHTLIMAPVLEDPNVFIYAPPQRDTRKRPLA